MIKNVKKILESSIEYKCTDHEVIKNFLYPERVYYPGQSVFFVGEQTVLTFFALQQMYYLDKNQYKTGIYFSTTESSYSLVNRLCYTVLGLNRFSEKFIT